MLKRQEVIDEMGRRNGVSGYIAGRYLQAFEDICLETIASNDCLYTKVFKIGGCILAPKRATGYQKKWGDKAAEEEYGSMFPARSGWVYMIPSPMARKTEDIPVEKYYAEYPDTETPEWIFRLTSLRYHNISLNRRLKWTLMAIIDRRTWIDRWDARMRLTLDKLKKQEDVDRLQSVIDSIKEEEERRTRYLGYRLDRRAANNLWLAEFFWEWKYKIDSGQWPDDDDSFGEYIDRELYKKFPEGENVFERRRMQDRDYLNKIVSFEDTYAFAKEEVNNAREAGFKWTEKGQKVYDPPKVENDILNKDVKERIKALGISAEEVEAAMNEGMELDEFYYNKILSLDYMSNSDGEDSDVNASDPTDAEEDDFSAVLGSDIDDDVSEDDIKEFADNTAESPNPDATDTEN